MNKYLILSIVFLLFFEMYVTYSQNNEILGEYSEGTVVTQNGKRLWAEDIILYNDYVAYTLQKGIKDTLALNDVLKVNAKSGNHAFEGALFGGSFSLLIFLSASISIQNQPNRYYTKYWEYTLYGTAIGTGVGLLIGLAFPKNKDVYVNGRFITQLQQTNPDYYVPFYNNQKIISIGFNF